MRYRGCEYTGKGITVAVIDSGINSADPRLKGHTVEGWHIQLGATGHALLGGDYSDENGHGTNMAAAVAVLAPEAKLVGVKIMDARLRTSADLMAAGIETAFRAGASVISLSLGTPNMGKALLLRDCCALAVENDAIVLAAAHPKGDRAYPADLPETVGVATHPDCPIEKFYYFAPHRFPRKQWGNLTAKFLTYGYEYTAGERGAFKGSGIATAYMAGRAACLREALPKDSAMNIIEVMRQVSLTPVPEIGYA
ncbi:MAG: S8 family serine peptidase [Oligoflexia bacterium]|nr:S8 family serine peptidase [Oligoflexia bacterium]